jgi:hypothetical protein
MFNFNSLERECSLEKLSEKILSPIEMLTQQVSAAQNYYAGLSKYVNDFLLPYLASTHYFAGVEQMKLMKTSPLESLQSYMDLMGFNMDVSNRFFTGSMRAVNEYNNKELQNALAAWFNTVFGLEGEDIKGFMSRQAKMIDAVANVYPQAIRDVEPEFGFHFERGGNLKIAETDRFIVYQIAPTDKSVKINESGKPILILPPYVLGANILAFLPGEQRSYTHCFANMGIPTYIRILKDIHVTPALQVMTAEDDARDTRFFCETIKARHGKPVTLNGYCQGGFAALCNILSGELDGLIDALITCVSPVDGTKSVGLSAEFLKALPPRFNDLAYGTKTLPNGNKVADGNLMGWVYKLKSIENEAPMVVFFRDMMMLSPKNGGEVKISKSAAAINYWLGNERTDLPLAITQMSFDSYNTPITKDGILPITMFGQKLDLHRLKEKGVRWLICYGEKDDLVEPAVALAALDHIEAEVTVFPKGHVAAATSWSNPKSPYALHTRFGENRQYRGPVRFQLDLDKELSERSETSADPVTP